MARIEQFEDLEAWQDARKLVNQIYEITNDGTFARDFVLRDQIRRASVSAMSNIAEGFERGSNKDFIRFLDIAKASVGEVRSQLYLALDMEYLDPERANVILRDAKSVSRQISGFIKYLQGKI